MKLPQSRRKQWPASPLNMCKSVGLGGIQRVLRELMEELSKSLSMIYQWSWWTREVSHNWSLANLMPHWKKIYKNGRKKDPGNYRLSGWLQCQERSRNSSSSVPSHSRCRATRDSSPARMDACKASSAWPTWSLSMTCQVDEGKAVDVVSLDLSKASDTNSCSILLKKPGQVHCSLGKKTSWMGGPRERGWVKLPGWSEMVHPGLCVGASPV